MLGWVCLRPTAGVLGCFSQFVLGPKKRGVLGWEKQGMLGSKKQGVLGSKKQGVLGCLALCRLAMVPVGSAGKDSAVHLGANGRSAFYVPAQWAASSSVG